MTIATQALSRATRRLGIRAQEARAVGLLMLVFGLGEAGRGLGMNASDALFFLRFGVDRLPWMYMALGLLTFLAVLFYAAGLSRFGWSFLHALYFGVALLLVVERFIIPLGVTAIYPALWLSVHVISWVLVTAAWSLASQSFDTRQAKRLFSFFASASILGGIFGNVITGWLADTIGTENLFLAYALLLLLALLVVRRLTDGLPQQVVTSDEETSPLSDVMAGVRTFKRSRLLQLIVVASVLFSILYFSVWFPFNQVVSTFYPDEASLAGFLGNFASVVMFSTLLVSLISNRIYARVGIVNVVLVVALIYLAGFSLWLVEFTIVTAIALRFTHMVWINGAGWSAWNALFNVFQAERKEQLRAFESGVPSQIGTSLSGVLLLLGERVLANQQIFLLGASAALLCVLVCWRMRHAYGQALLDAIRGGLVNVFTGSPGGLGRLGADSQARQTVLDSLQDSDPSVRRISARLLARIGIDEPDPLISLLDDDAATVRQAAVESLADLEASSAVAALTPLLSDPAPNVRRATVRALENLNPTEAWLDEVLDDEVPMVRAEAAAAQFALADRHQGKEVLRGLLLTGDRESTAAALRTIKQRDFEWPLADLVKLTEEQSPEIRRLVMEILGNYEADLARDLVLSGLADSDWRVQSAAAEAARTMQVAASKLFKVIENGSLSAQKAALKALTIEADADRESLIEWTLDQVSELESLQGWRARLALEVQQNGNSAILFLADLLERRQAACTELVLQALRKLGPEDSLDLVEQGLASEDRALQMQALEALETLVEPRIVRAFIPILEAEPERTDPPTLDSVLRNLSQSPDPWIRAFALRTRAERLRSQLNQLQMDVEHDGSEIVQEVWDEVAPLGNKHMKQTIDTLSTMERILYLRKIPIFEGLNPDDLHRIAEISEEQTIPEGDYLCREGMLEDELYLIVEGEVSVTKEAEDGPKELRRIGMGQPVGELAILASQPRSASVRAVGGRLKVLVIDGQDFQSILRDRPEVSSAMLANLARRLSTLV